MSTVQETAGQPGLEVAVPLVEEVPLALPFWRYAALYRSSAYSFLLDSAKDPDKLGRYSFLGGDPVLVYKAWRRPGEGLEAGGSIEVLRFADASGTTLESPALEARQGDVFEDLRRTLGPYNVAAGDYPQLPLPFLGGAVGYFGYEAGYFVEELPDVAEDDIDLPDIYLMVVDTCLGHCHRSGVSYLSVIGRGTSRQVAEEQARRRRDALLERIAAFEAEPPPEWQGPPPAATNGVEVPVKSFFDAASYSALVEQAKEHIYAGDIYEVCTTHRLEAPYDGPAWDLYQELRRINPAPFACYLEFPEASVVSSSPERFLRLDRNRVAESRPIKGTRPRGVSPEEDEATARELASSVKDRAENMMIVDLVRNDFGRVCEFHTVRVPELMVVEKYATVFQLVSTIQGHLMEGYDGLDLIQACFPGGSMTGAPKIEAMKIIDRLEPVKRGIYSGSIGYIDFTGALDLNIVIRTFVVKDGRCFYNVGGAVVSDSDPLGEYRESMDKAAALTDSLRNLKALAAPKAVAEGEP